MIICGTGHRPDKLGGYTDEVSQRLQHTAAVWLADHPDVDMVISGGALGWDQALAAAARELSLKYIMALPFPGFEDRWPQSSRAFLYGLIHDAHDAHHICESGYAGWKMQERNKWMVDNSNQVLALWNGTTGGTSNCVKYAEKVGKPIVNLWDKYDSREG